MKSYYLVKGNFNFILFLLVFLFFSAVRSSRIKFKNLRILHKVENLAFSSESRINPLSTHNEQEVKKFNALDFLKVKKKPSKAASMKPSMKRLGQDDVFQIDLNGEQDVFFDILGDTEPSKVEINLLINSGNRSDIDVNLKELINTGYCDFFLNSAALADVNFRKVAHSDKYSKFTKYNKENKHFQKPLDSKVFIITNSTLNITSLQVNNHTKASTGHMATNLTTSKNSTKHNVSSNSALNATHEGKKKNISNKSNTTSTYFKSIKKANNSGNISKHYKFNKSVIFERPPRNLSSLISSLSNYTNNVSYIYINNYMKKLLNGSLETNNSTKSLADFNILSKMKIDLFFKNFSYTNLTINIKRPHNATHNKNIKKNITLMIHDPKTGHLCSICYELSNSINILFSVIKKLQFEFKVRSSRKYTRQEQIIELTNWLNYVNLVKSAFYKINEVYYAIQEDYCKEDIERNLKYLGAVSNFVSQLVDIIQRTIRQQNLNLSLIILT